jgi:hypothetical protein
MRQVGPVMSRLSRIEFNRERLTALGTMAAGLAHELNNPAAAAKRSAATLVEALDVLSQTLGRFVESGIEREQAQQLVDLQRDAWPSRSPQPAWTPTGWNRSSGWPARPPAPRSPGWRPHSPPASSPPS